MDGLEAEWGDSVDVLRLNVHDEGAKTTLQQLQFRFTPTFVLLDTEGREVWRSIGAIDAVTARQQVMQLREGR